MVCAIYVMALFNLLSKEIRESLYRFSSLQSEAGQELLAKAGLPQKEIRTVVLYDQGKFYTHSDVVLRMVKDLGGLWPLLSIFSIIPKSMRDQIYNWVARNRYNWFGKKDSLYAPNSRIKKSFFIIKSFTMLFNQTFFPAKR